MDQKYLQYIGIFISVISFSVIIFRAIFSKEESEVKINFKEWSGTASTLAVVFTLGLTLIVSPWIISYYFSKPNDISPASILPKNSSGKAEKYSCGQIELSSSKGEKIVSDETISFRSKKDLRNRIDGEKADGIGWVYYGNFAAGEWKLQNFTSGSGSNGLPIVRDKIAATSNVHLREGPQERTSVGWLNNSGLRVICIGEKYIVTSVLELGNGYFWVKID